MAKKNRKKLKEIWHDGYKPDEKDFADVFDSQLNISSDIEDLNAPPVNFKNGITIGNVTDNKQPNGTIKWSGNQFERLKDKRWEPLGKNKWSEGSNKDIYYSEGKVGVGMEPQKANLQVADSALIETNYNGKLELKLRGNDIEFNRPNNYSYISNKGTKGGICFSTNGASWNNAKMVISGDGRVGIGTTGPKAKLHLKDGNFGLENENKPDMKFMLMNTSIGESQGYKFSWRKGNNWESERNAALAFDKTGDLYMMGGKVGIGTTQPRFKLEVNGIIGCSSLYCEEDIMLANYNGTASGLKPILSNLESRIKKLEKK